MTLKKMGDGGDGRPRKGKKDEEIKKRRGQRMREKSLVKREKFKVLS